MKPVVIIGAGLAGYTLAREFRKLDKTGPIVIVTADNGDFYSKPMLSNAYALRKDTAQLISQTAAQIALQIDAQVITDTRVVSIDTRGKVLMTSDATIGYEKLVIAVGAKPIRLPIAGSAADQVLPINHVTDYAIFRARIESSAVPPTRRITILGAGLIGCEFADDLAGAGHLVTIVDPNALPLAALCAPALSLGLHAALCARGVILELGTTAAGIDHDGDALRVTLANGHVFSTDVVLSAVGLRADLALATAAGITTSRGIVVDSTGRTSAPDVYALGDCAEYTSHLDNSTKTLPYIAPLMTAARAIARTLSGQVTHIDLKPAPVIVKTPSYPLALMPPPMSATATGKWMVEIIGYRTICRFFDAEGVMAGFGVSHQEAGVRSALMAELGTQCACGVVI
jgi:rubredoxin-NAD+ reductase